MSAIEWHLWGALTVYLIIRWARWRGGAQGVRASGIVDGLRQEGVMEGSERGHMHPQSIRELMLSLAPPSHGPVPG